ncbi:MAG: biosynthetic-type acetolactate synthase large subunit [Bacteroidales bacterium]|nr:biosynthetic-type acetolactate synthase large subunit [Clostridium sp.]MCM1202619.1 biosynthetic-type acetolactate synthase large subunit [Bacteroidales bacterium]
MKQLTGSEIIIECLKEQGVDTVFGYPGGTILNVYDALYQHQDEITHVLTSHEQGASHAADGYARATGKVGVCMATSGPGATNLVTGIATAYMDSIPMVAITANVGVSLLGKDSFQEVDIAGVVMPVTKHSFIVKNVHELAKTIRRAFKIAQTGRPGPVLVDVTKDVTSNLADYEYKKPEEILPVTGSIKEEELNEVAKLIKKSKKPFIMAGGGVVAAGAYREFRQFAKLMDAPVCDTLMGKGVMDGNDSHYTGMVGMHGTKVSNFGVTASDLLVVVGGRFSDRVIGNAKKFANDAKIVQIDVDAAEINKNIVVDASIVGDAKEVLARLNQMIEQKDNREWLEEIEALKKQFPNTYPTDKLTGPTVISKIYELTKGDAIITTDVGQHQMWAAQMYRYKEPRQLLTSGGLGTMGYGLGASIGAKVSRRDKVVVNIAGDGCFRMNMNEIATAARYNIPIIQVVINNHVLGMVRQWQTLFYDKRYSNTVLNDAVDFVKVSEGMGALAFRAETLPEFEEAFKKALEAGRPCVIDAQIDADDKVWPMVAAGQPIATCFSEEDIEK